MIIDVQLKMANHHHHHHTRLTYDVSAASNQKA